MNIMPYMGKVLGFVFGFLLLRFPGALLGLLVGHLFDKGISNDFSRSGGFGRFFANDERLQSSAIFFHALFASLGHIAKADGAVTQAEIDVALGLMDDMNLNENDRQEAQQAFREGKDANFPLRNILKDLKHDLHGRKDVLTVFLEILIQTSFADGQLSVSEVEVLDSVASELGFTHKELDKLIRRFEAEMRFRQRQDAFSQAREQARSHAQEQANAWYQQNQQRQQQSRHSGSGQYSQGSAYTEQQTLADAYRILGVAANVEDKTLKRAYKKAMNEHHPDKLMAKGLPEQALQMAKTKTQHIQAAYEIVKQSRK
mgnify:CR=1 FL=1